MKKLCTLLLMLTYLVCGAQTLTKINEPLHFSDQKEFQGKLFFFSDDGSHGYGLYYLDQNSDVLHFLSTAVQPSTIITSSNKLYFINDDGVHGKELWVSDGTTAGTFMLKDIYSGFGNAFPNEFRGKALGNQFFFMANDGVNGDELWKTDGTVSGTAIFKDINIGSASSNPFFFETFNSRLYFGATDAVNGIQLWETQGTASSTFMSYMTSYSNDQLAFTRFNDKALIRIRETDLQYHIFGIDSNDVYIPLSAYVPQATSKNQKWMLMDAVNQYTSVPIIVNGKLLVSLDDSTYILTDLTNSGTQTVTAPLPPYYLNSPIVLGNKLLYTIWNGSSNVLYSTDFTTSTPLVPDISSYGAYPYLVNNKVVFRRADSFGSEPWVTDGTVSGTNRLKDINTGSGDGIQPDHSWRTYTYNNHLYFTDVFSPSNLWKTDGTSTGTVKVSGAVDSFFTEVYDFTPYNGCIYLNASRSEFSSHSSIWKLCDGTSGINPSSEESILIYPNPTQNQLTIGSSELFSSYEVSNTVGEILAHGVLKDNTVTTTDFPAGLYLLHIYTKTGETRSIKFIKE